MGRDRHTELKAVKTRPAKAMPLAGTDFQRFNRIRSNGLFFVDSTQSGDLAKKAALKRVLTTRVASHRL
jgi:hypothetical protein